MKCFNGYLEKMSTFYTVYYQYETRYGRMSKCLHWIYTLIGERDVLVYVSRSLILINSGNEIWGRLWDEVRTCLLKAA